MSNEHGYENISVVVNTGTGMISRTNLMKRLRNPERYPETNSRKAREIEMEKDKTQRMMSCSELNSTKQYLK